MSKGEMHIRIYALTHERINKNNLDTKRTARLATAG